MSSLAAFSAGLREQALKMFLQRFGCFFLLVSRNSQGREGPMFDLVIGLIYVGILLIPAIVATFSIDQAQSNE